MKRTITKTVGYSDYHKTNYTRTFTLVDSQEQIIKKERKIKLW